MTPYDDNVHFFQCLQSLTFMSCIYVYMCMKGPRFLYSSLYMLQVCYFLDHKTSFSILKPHVLFHIPNLYDDFLFRSVTHNNSEAFCCWSTHYWLLSLASYCRLLVIS